MLSVKGGTFPTGGASTGTIGPSATAVATTPTPGRDGELTRAEMNSATPSPTTAKPTASTIPITRHVRLRRGAVGRLKVEYEDCGGDSSRVCVTAKRGRSLVDGCRSTVVPQYMQLPLSPFI